MMKLNCQGFSIVELIVSIAIGLFIMGGLGSVLITSKDMFNNEQGSSFIQENARYAIETLKRDLRIAGSASCSNMDLFGDSVELAVTVPESQFKGLLDLDVDGSFGMEALTGFEYGASGATPSNTYPDVFGNEVDGSDSDAIIVRYADPSSAVTVDNHNSGSSEITATTNHNFAVGDVLAVVDSTCRHVGVFQTSSVGPSTVSHSASGSTSEGNCSNRIFPADSSGGCNCGITACSSPASFKRGSQLMSFVSHAYYIAESNLLPGVPALKRRVMTGKNSSGSRVEELAQGVESLQFTYGLDTDADGIVDTREEANSIADWSQVVTVRYQLVLRSLENVLIENGPQGDRFLRQTVNGAVQLRNR